MSNLVLSSLEANVLTLTLNRPEKKNAITQEMYRILAEELSRANEDPEVRVILIQGSEGVFTAGNDLKDFASFSKNSALRLRDLPVVPFMYAVMELNKPLLAAVQGAAVGIGTTLLLHCDMVIADASAKFSLPFVHLGLVPEFGSTYLLPRIIGRIRAHALLLEGKPFGFKVATEMGLISHPVENATTKAPALAKEIAQLPLATLQATKMLLNNPNEKEILRQVVEKELSIFEKKLQSPEHQKALQAFFSR